MFRKWVGLAVLSSVLERKCSWERGFLKIYPNIYVVLIGDPGTKKGTAMGQGYAFLEDVIEDIAADQTSRQALVSRMCKAKKTHLDPETGERIVHSSYTIFSPEFTTFIGYKDVEFLTVLGDWFDCGRGKRGLWSADTISRSSEEVEGMWVCILGATTSQLLYSALPIESIGGGFLSRIFTIIYRGLVKRKVAKEFNQEERELIVKLGRDLEKIHSLSGVFTFSEELDGIWDTWYETKCVEESKLDKDKFKDFLNRRALHVIKLMMLVNVSRTDSMVIEVEDFERARRLLEEVESGMSGSYDRLGKYEHVQLLADIKDFLREKGEWTLVGLIYRNFQSHASKEIIGMIIDSLVIAGEVERRSNTKGTFLKWKEENG